MSIKPGQSGETETESIARIAQASINIAARFHKPSDEPKGYYYVEEQDGTLARVKAKPADTLEVSKDFHTIARRIEQADTGYTNADATSKAAEVWYDRSGVIGILPNGRIKLAATFSAPFKLIREWERAKGVAYKQIALYALLRTALIDCMDKHPDFLKLISKLDFKKVQEASSSVQAKGVSMSKSLVAEASGADLIPEVITFMVTIYENPLFSVRRPIRVACVLDANDESFKFWALPGEVENACVEAEAHICKRMNEALLEADLSDVPLYYGSPE